MSTLSVGTIKSISSSAPVFQNSSGTEKGQLAKVWINFKGSGTVSIRDSFNVSSLVDNGTGDYTVNFTNAMSNANYCSTGMCTYLMGQVARYRIISGYVWNTGSHRVVTGYRDTFTANHEVVGVLIFGDN